MNLQYLREQMDEDDWDDYKAFNAMRGIDVEDE